ncbi:hypothetical protein B0H12DRAFT_125964 [Mycena haematopus]|nr:hypothetical protein B0H12DRAFT_125964 [Mycena haematopus]
MTFSSHAPTPPAWLEGREGEVVDGGGLERKEERQQQGEGERDPVERVQAVGGQYALPGIGNAERWMSITRSRGREDAARAEAFFLHSYPRLAPPRLASAVRIVGGAVIDTPSLPPRLVATTYSCTPQPRSPSSPPRPQGFPSSLSGVGISTHSGRRRHGYSFAPLHLDICADRLRLYPAPHHLHLDPGKVLCHCFDTGSPPLPRRRPSSPIVLGLRVPEALGCVYRCCTCSRARSGRGLGSRSRGSIIRGMQSMWMWVRAKDTPLGVWKYGHGEREGYADSANVSKSKPYALVEHAGCVLHPHSFPAPPRSRASATPSFA